MTLTFYQNLISGPDGDQCHLKRMALSHLGTVTTQSHSAQCSSLLECQTSSNDIAWSFGCCCHGGKKCALEFNETLHCNGILSPYHVALIWGVSFSQGGKTLRHLVIVCEVVSKAFSGRGKASVILRLTGREFTACQSLVVSSSWMSLSVMTAMA